MPALSHGATSGGTRKRPKRTPEYRAWVMMRARCNLPCFKNHAGRGLKVCKRWNSFPAFLSDMGPRPQMIGVRYTVERINNDKGYAPSNCKWATYREQARNRRSNKPIRYKGETRLIAEWAEQLGIHRKTLGRRINDGWPIEVAFTMPVPAPRWGKPKHLRKPRR